MAHSEGKHYLLQGLERGIVQIVSSALETYANDVRCTNIHPVNHF
jgi:hypothetical protein